MESRKGDDEEDEDMEEDEEWQADGEVSVMSDISVPRIPRLDFKVFEPRTSSRKIHDEFDKVRNNLSPNFTPEKNTELGLAIAPFLRSIQIVEEVFQLLNECAVSTSNIA